MWRILRMVIKKGWQLYFAGICLFTLSALFYSCASKAPALYRNGEPLSIIEYEKIAQQEYEKKRYEYVIAAYETIVKYYPNNPSKLAWAHYEIGFSYYVQEMYDKAEYSFNIVINDYQEPAARKLAQDMLVRTFEKKNSEKKRKR
jgi:TolA-binding protein